METKAMQDTKDLPKITLAWDQEKQSVFIEFQTEQFKTWDFVVGVLGIAKDQAEFNRNMARAADMQRQAAEQQHLMAIRNNLKF